MPPLAIPSLEVERSPRTAHEYGLSAARQALKFRFQEAPEAQLRQAELGFRRVNKTGQGNRVKNSYRDEACEEVAIPCGDFAFETETVFAGRFSDQIEGHVPERGEIGGGVIGADTAFVVAEDHIHHPV